MDTFFETRERKIYYETFEVYHPAIGTIRYVNGQFVDKLFTIESDADRNAGQIVTFKAASFVQTPPSISEDGVLSITNQLGRIGSQMKQYMKAIAAYRDLNPNTTPAEYILREYLQGQDQPAGIVKLSISGVVINNDAVAITASDDNANSINVARRYRAQDFPGLKVIS